jgi:hypothetical protein
LIVRIVTPLQNYADFDVRPRHIHKSPTPIKNESDRIGSEFHAFVQRDVLRFHRSVTVKIHLHAVGSFVEHF